MYIFYVYAFFSVALLSAPSCWHLCQYIYEYGRKGTLMEVMYQKAVEQYVQGPAAFLVAALSQQTTRQVIEAQPYASRHYAG